MGDLEFNDEFYGNETTTTWPPWLPKNATVFCKELEITDGWYITGLGTVIVSALVVITFAILFYLHRKDGPKVWRSSWLPIFLGYLAMQAVAVLLYGYFMPYTIGFDEKGIIARALFCILSWGGYWVVGQFLIISPLIDIGCFKWKGIFKIVNYVLCFLMLLVYIYFEYNFQNPWENHAFKQFFAFTRLVVYVGNVLVLVEVVYYKWYAKMPGFLIYLCTILNGFALYFTFKYVGDSDFLRKNCLYYVLEAISLVLIWRFFIITREEVMEHLNPEFYLNLNSIYAN